MHFNNAIKNVALCVIYECIYNLFPNKRNFRGPGGVGSRLDSRHGPKSVRGKWPLWPPVVSHGLQGPPVADGRTIDIVPKFQIRHWDVF